VILPDNLAAQDYSGSLVNVIIAYAFLEEIAAEGHTGVIVMAGRSATGFAVAALTQERNIPALLLVRSPQAHEALWALNVQHVLATSDDDFHTKFQQLAEHLKATAVFDRVGGELISRTASACRCRCFLLRLPGGPGSDLHPFRGLYDEESDDEEVQQFQQRDGSRYEETARCPRLFAGADRQPALQDNNWQDFRLRSDSRGHGLRDGTRRQGRPAREACFSIAEAAGGSVPQAGSHGTLWVPWVYVWAMKSPTAGNSCSGHL
jgi:hypothetical protein